MITLHCACGETLRTGLGPASVTCKCGAVHSLPSLGPPPAPAPNAPTPPRPAAPAAPPAPPPPPATAELGRRATIRPPHERNAASDLRSAQSRPASGLDSLLRNPVAAGGLSAAILLVALLVALGLRLRAKRVKEEAEAKNPGTECSFVNAGVSFVAPPSWKMTRSENLVFSFETPKGVVAVSLLHPGQETHEDRAKALAPPGVAWSRTGTELEGAEALEARWEAEAPRAGVSWMMVRPNHRLWITAVGSPGIREAAAPVFRSLKLSAPTSANTPGGSPPE